MIYPKLHSYDRYFTTHLTRSGFSGRDRKGKYLTRDRRQTVKIGRFAVSTEYRGRNIGSELMDKLKITLTSVQSYSAFRYITVDAYISAIPFYEKNGFTQLNEKDENEHTRLMFFDKMSV
ncbi:MAG: GNAT family N-acetyltransferase [Muribaculaceae bacterium]|nr:GNAT family N-acetyltransferase [Muribaculaceae bacterium]